MNDAIEAGWERVRPEREARRVFDHVLDIIESLELENLGNLLRIEELEEKIQRLHEEKITLARKLEWARLEPMETGE